MNSKLILGKPNHIKALSLVAGLLIIPVVVFFALRNKSPSRSELSFVEHSTLGRSAGTVVPASCESGVAHYTSDCNVVNEALGFGTLPSDGLNISFYTTNPVNAVAYGFPLNLVWSVTGASTCTASGDGGDWSGSKTAATGQTAALTYTNNTGAIVIRTYTLACTDGKRTKAASFKAAWDVPVSQGGFEPSSCYVEETLISLEDGSKVRADELAVGDRVLGIGGVNTVTMVERVTLGTWRKLYDIGGLRISGEHNIWTRVGEDENWAVADMDSYNYERTELGMTDANGNPVGLLKREPRNAFEAGLEFAVTDGWKALPSVLLDAPHDTVLMKIATDGSHSVIANDIVVGAIVTDDYDYTTVKWTGVANRTETV